MRSDHGSRLAREWGGPMCAAGANAGCCGCDKAHAQARATATVILSQLSSFFHIRPGRWNQGFSSFATRHENGYAGVEAARFPRHRCSD